AVRGEEAPALLAHRIRHREDQAVALDRAHEREPDSGVPARRLDHHVARTEHALALRRFDHAETDAILDAAAEIRELELRPDLRSAVAGKALQAHDRGVSDELERG